MSMPRVILDISILFSLFVAPFYVSLILMIIGLLFIPYYWESVALLFCVELLYLGPFPSLTMSIISPPMIALVLFFAVQHVRRLAQEQLFHF